MSYSRSRILSTIVMSLLAAVLLPGCSDDECPSCPTGETGGARLTLNMMHPDPEPYYYLDVWAAGPNDVFIATSPGVILRRQNSDWKHYDTGTAQTFNAIWGTSGDNVFAVGEAGQIVHFDGSQWSSMYSGVLNSLNAVWGPAPDTVYVAGFEATVLKYDGNSWSEVVIPLPTDQRYAMDIWGSSSDDIWFVGANWSTGERGLRWHLDGTVWSDSYAPEVITTIWGSHADTVMTGDQNGQVYQYDGANWNLHPTQPGPEIQSMWGSAPDDVWAAFNVGGPSGYDGYLSHFDGQQWGEVRGVVLDSGARGVSGVGADEVYAVGGGALLTGWNGADWSTLNDNRVTAEELTAVWGTSTDNLWAFGRRGQIFQYDGFGWSDTTLAGVTERISDAWGSAPNDVYAVGEMGTIVHFDGSAWDRVDHGLPPATLLSIWGTAANDIWVGGPTGQMMYYDGSGWELRDTWDYSYFTAHSLWGSAPNDYYAVLYSGAMHFDGSSWSVVPLDGLTVVDAHGVSPAEVYFLVVGHGLGSVAESQKTGVSGVQRTPTGNTLVRYDGSDYVVLAQGIDADLTRIWALGSNNIFFSGNWYGQPVIAHYDGSGVTVKTADTSAYCHDLWCTGSNTAFAVGYLGMVLQATAR